MEQDKFFIGVARVKSTHFENVFDKPSREYTKEQIDKITNDMFAQLNENENIEETNEKTKNIVKIVDFAIGYAKANGMTGSELFSLLLSKEQLCQ